MTRHRRPRATIPLEARFWAKVDKAGPVPAHAPELGPCWIWTGTISSNGHGMIRGRMNGRRATLVASRVALEMALGRPIRPGLAARHRCGNPACVNPEHLYEGILGAGGHARPTRARLVLAQVAGIRAMAAAGERLATIAARFHVSVDRASDVVRGVTYRDMV